MAETLLPCPFCGGEARLSAPTCRPETPYNPSDRLYPIAICVRGCGATVPGENEDYRGGTAVTAWNRRAAPTEEER